ncbi:hypothetical protein [Mycolicibacterium pulveris]
MNFTTITAVSYDGTTIEVPLSPDPCGYRAVHGGTAVFVTTVRTDPAAAR